MSPSTIIQLSNATSFNNNFYFSTTGSSFSSIIGTGGTGGNIVPCPHYDGQITVKDGQPCIIDLPDGTRIDVMADGSFEINDTDAKVIYRANRKRDFNPFLNASDKLEDFIRFCGEQGVRQGDMLKLPINLFIAWLIVEAAKADQEPEPMVPLIPDLRKHLSPRCVSCGRFISREFVRKQIGFCRPICFDKHYAMAA